MYMIFTVEWKLNFLFDFMSHSFIHSFVYAYKYKFLHVWLPEPTKSHDRNILLNQFRMRRAGDREWKTWKRFWLMLVSFHTNAFALVFHFVCLCLCVKIICMNWKWKKKFILPFIIRIKMFFFLCTRDTSHLVKNFPLKKAWKIHEKYLFISNIKIY